MKTFQYNDLITLPTDVLGVIYQFIPLTIQQYTTKKKYLEHFPSHIAKIVEYNRLATYVRDLIRRKHSFIFALLLSLKYDQWYKIKNYRCKIGPVTLYKAPTYIVYLTELCHYYQSNACKAVIINYEKEKGKKTYKKIKFKNIRWSN